jgi:hypothetical protein
MKHGASDAVILADHSPRKVPKGSRKLTKGGQKVVMALQENVFDISNPNLFVFFRGSFGPFCGE